MNISMNLSLVDTASEPVKAFISTLQALEAAVNNIGGKLAGMTSGMDAFVASLGLVKASSAEAATELGVLGAQAGATAAETAGLKNSMAGLSASLKRVSTRVAETTSGLAGIGGAASVAATETNAAMNAVGTGAQNANTHVNSLAQSLKGMAALWAAFKIEKGLKESVVDAADYERTENRLRNMKLSPGESEGIHQAVRKAGKDFHQFDQNEYLEMAIDLRNATGSAKEAATGLKGFAESVFAMNLAMPNGQKLDGQGQLNFAKLLEGRGVTMDPARMEAMEDLIVKMVLTTQGRVNPSNLFGNLSYAKGGLGQTMDDEAFKVMGAMIEQDQVGGGTGGRIGTMLTALVNSVTKSRAVTTKNRDEWMKLGLIDPNKVNINENTDRVTSIQAGAIAGTQIIGKNFKQWVDEYLRPALVKAGVNMDDLTDIKQKTDILFPNSGAAEAAFQLLARKKLIEKDVDNFDRTAGKDEQVKHGLETPGAQWDRFKASISDLGMALGKTLLPALTPILQGLTKFIELLGSFTKDHPIFGNLSALSLAVVGVSLAISGVKNVFGVFGTLTQALVGVAGQATKTGAAVTGGAAATQAAAVRTAATSQLFGGLGAAFARLGGAVTAAAGVVARGFLKMIPLVGTLLVAWDFAALIGQLEIGGHKISDWAESLADRVTTSFKNMWIRTKEYFGFLSKDAADAQVDANNRAWAHRLVQFASNGTRPTRGVRGGASGDWDRGEEVSPAAKAVEDDLKRQKAIDAQLAANKADSAGLLGSGKKGGRFKNYDANLDDAKNDLRLEEDELARHMKAEEELYKANKISINEYYDDKLATMRKSVNAQIKELEREKAAYQKQGDKAGVNRTNTEITLRKRDLADNEKSVEVQREKDLNDLKKEAIALEAQMLEAEGKRSEAHMAREIAELEEKKKRFAINKDQENVDLTQRDIDIAKLTMAWERYGDEVKKIQEAAQTKEAAVDAEVRSGNLTKLSAEQKVFDLRKEEARQLDDLIKKERALIEASNAPEAVKARLRQALDLAQGKADAALSQTKTFWEHTKETLDTSLPNGFANFFNNVISGAKSGASAFKEFADSVKSTLTRLISEQLGKDLFKSLFGEGGVGSGGGLFGGLVSGLKGLFGGKSSGPNANADISMVNGGSGGGMLDSIVGWFRSFDVGTDYVPQDMIAHIHKGEMIVPAYDAERLRSLKPGQANAAPPAVTLQIHPDAIHMTLSDWLNGELSRQLAHR
jgi:hypothetical protein